MKKELELVEKTSLVDVGVSATLVRIPERDQKEWDQTFSSISGCFAGGIYLALHYTLLQPGQTELKDQAMAILSLFPIVSSLHLEMIL